mmetsp:Transcript_3837/g.10647  ORF Transcript_3837/g.10647 Transcript_3837/m.10647 type:complete len:135 (-) Transcript_3837:1368-1772(-)
MRRHCQSECHSVHTAHTLSPSNQWRRCTEICATNTEKSLTDTGNFNKAKKKSETNISLPLPGLRATAFARARQAPGKVGWFRWNVYKENHRTNISPTIAALRSLPAQLTVSVFEHCEFMRLAARYQVIWPHRFS